MPERSILMLPGPTEIPWRVIRAMMRPSISHHDPRFNEDVFDATLIKLRKIFQTKNEVIAVPGSGRVALESAVQSVIEPGDRVINVVAGVFGGWMKEMVERIGANAVELKVEPGKPIDLEKLERLLSEGELKALTMVHNETSTGSTYPVAEVSRLVKSKGMLLLVDTVSSLGGIDVPTDDLCIDMNMSSPQKCIAAPMGLAFVSVSDQALQAMKNRNRPATSFSYDLLRWWTMWLPPERGGDLIYGWRRMPITTAVHTVYALAEAVDIILEEGLENRFQRHTRNARAFRAAMEAMGVSLLPDESLRSDSVSCVRLPEGIKPKDVTTLMDKRFGIQIASGMGDLKDFTVRIGHMGAASSVQYIAPTITAFGETLNMLGARVDVKAGLDAFLALSETDG